jgi:hypothetical protein
VRLEFRGEIFVWRGPAPYFFVAVPPAEAARIAGVARSVTYGWGVIPSTVTLGRTRFGTSLFPKDGGYLVPVKAAVRRAEAVDEGDIVDLAVDIEM